MSYQYLTLSHTGPIATVTFNRPEKANATNFGLLQEIEQVSLSFREDLTTRAVIFTGEGKNFCSGFDLSDDNRDYGETTLERRRTTRIGGRAIQAICDIDQITISAWQGAAVGGGAVITTATDFRIGTATTRMCYPEVVLGMNLMWFGLPLIVHLVGPARAKRLVAGAEAGFHGLDIAEFDPQFFGNELPALLRQAAAHVAVDPCAKAPKVEKQGLLRRRRAGPHDRPVAQDVVLHGRADPP